MRDNNVFWHFWALQIAEIWRYCCIINTRCSKINRMKKTDLVKKWQFRVAKRGIALVVVQFACDIFDIYLI